MKVYLSRPDITDTEIGAVTQVLRSPNLSLGPELGAFEQDFCQHLGTQRAIAVSSGTAALLLCLKAMNIGPGDEVITTPFTFISSVTSIITAGAKPVLVDIDPVSLNLDPAGIENHITDQTKAILPVEVFGNPAHMDTYRHCADQHGLLMIEDSCEALGSTLNGRAAGTFGDMATFAFYPNKQITTGEGGMIVTNSDIWADLCVSLRNQGRGSNGAWLAHERLGYNFRLSDINCVLGRVQLSRLEEFKVQRQRVARSYQERLMQDRRLIVPQAAKNVDMSWFVFVVRLQDNYPQEHRDQLIAYLHDQGIQASNYFTPVHLQPFMVEALGHRPGDFPTTESVSARTLALPFYNRLSEADIDLVCHTLKQGLDQLGI